MATAPDWVAARRGWYAPGIEQLAREPSSEPHNPEYPYTLDLRRSVSTAKAESDELLPLATLEAQ